MIPINFKLTNAGSVAAWNEGGTGFDLNLTHIQFGSGNRVADGTETALLDPKQSVTFGGSVVVSDTQRRLSAIAQGALQYTVSEIGLWQGAPGEAGSVLAFYWAKESGAIGAKYPDADFIFQHDMSLSDSIPAGGVTIVVDTSASAMLAMLAAHESHPNPHAGYLTETNADARYLQLSQLSEEVSTAVADHAAATNPHPQYVTLQQAHAIALYF